MSDSFTATLIASFIGASAAITAGPLLESYRRHKNMQGTASAIAGEIYAILDLTERRKHIEIFKNVLSSLEAGTNIEVGNIYGHASPQLDPIIANHIQHLGLLSIQERLPERITTFYSYLQGIRIDLISLDERNIESKIFVIKEDLELWNVTEELGKTLINDLRELSRSYWLSGIFSVFSSFIAKLK